MVVDCPLLLFEAPHLVDGPGVTFPPLTDSQEVPSREGLGTPYKWEETSPSVHLPWDWMTLLDLQSPVEP